MRCKESYITYYLIAAALLLNALERQKSQQSTCQLLYINYCIRSTFGTSPILSSIICVSTSVIAVSLLIDSCVLFIWYICDISVVFLYFFFVVGIGLLVDLFFVRHVYTFVNGLFDIFFACFLVGIFRDTLVLAGLVAVKCCHMGLLLSCASSFTHFMLWSMTGLHLFIHFFNCWFVSSYLESSVLSYIFNISDLQRFSFFIIVFTAK